MSAIMRKAAAAGLLALLASSGFAQFPARPLRLVVPYPAGGNGDVVARILAADMAKGLGQYLVVETRPGAVCFARAERSAAEGGAEGNMDAICQSAPEVGSRKSECRKAGKLRTSDFQLPALLITFSPY